MYFATTYYVIVLLTGICKQAQLISTYTKQAPIYVHDFKLTPTHNFAYKNSILSVVANQSRYVAMYYLIMHILNNYLAIK